MLDLKKEFGTDKQKELEGTWEEVGGGARILIARVGNPNFAKAFRQLPRSVRRLLDMGSLPESQGEDLLADLMANSIILNWDGFSDEGKALPYNKANVKKMLIKYPDFREFIWQLASDRQLFQEEEEEQASKN